MTLNNGISAGQMAYQQKLNSLPSIIQSGKKDTLSSKYQNSCSLKEKNIGKIASLCTKEKFKHNYHREPDNSSIFQTKGAMTMKQTCL